MDTIQAYKDSVLLGLDSMPVLILNLNRVNWKRKDLSSLRQRIELQEEQQDLEFAGRYCICNTLGIWRLLHPTWISEGLNEIHVPFCRRKFHLHPAPLSEAIYPCSAYLRYPLFSDTGGGKAFYIQIGIRMCRVFILHRKIPEKIYTMAEIVIK